MAMNAKPPPTREDEERTGPGMKRSRFPLHSILLSVYPIIYLFARNMVFVAFEDTIRFLALSVGSAVLFLLGCRIILRGWEKAGVLCSLLAILFYSFGHAANSLERWTSQKDLTFDVSILAWMWLFGFLLLTSIILRMRLPARTSQLLNVTSAILVAFPLVTIVSTTVVNSHNPVSNFLDGQMSNFAA